MDVVNKCPCENVQIILLSFSTTVQEGGGRDGWLVNYFATRTLILCPGYVMYCNVVLCNVM